MFGHGVASTAKSNHAPTVDAVFDCTLAALRHIFIVGLILWGMPLLSDKKFERHAILYSAISMLYIFTEVEFDEARASFWKDEPKEEENDNLRQGDVHEDPVSRLKEEKRSFGYFNLHVTMDALLLIENMAFLP